MPHVNAPTSTLHRHRTTCGNIMHTLHGTSDVERFYKPLPHPDTTEWTIRRCRVRVGCRYTNAMNLLQMPPTVALLQKQLLFGAGERRRKRARTTTQYHKLLRWKRSGATNAPMVVVYMDNHIGHYGDFMLHSSWLYLLQASRQQSDAH